MKNEIMSSAKSFFPGGLQVILIVLRKITLRMQGAQQQQPHNNTQHVDTECRPTMPNLLMKAHTILSCNALFQRYHIF